MVWRTEGKVNKKRKKPKLKRRRKNPRNLVKSNRRGRQNCQLTFTSKENSHQNLFLLVRSIMHFQYVLQWSEHTLHKKRPKRISQIAWKLVETILHSWQLGQNPIGALSVSIAALVHQSTSSLCQLQRIWSTNPTQVSVDSFIPCRASGCSGWTTPCPNAPQKPHKCSSTFVPSWTEPT